MTGPFEEFETHFPGYEITEMNVIGPLVLNGASEPDIQYARDLLYIGFIDPNASPVERRDARAELVGDMRDSGGFFWREGYIDSLGDVYGFDVEFDWQQWREEYMSV